MVSQLVFPISVHTLRQSDMAMENPWKSPISSLIIPLNRTLSGIFNDFL